MYQVHPRLKHKVLHLSGLKVKVRKGVTRVREGESLADATRYISAFRFHSKMFACPTSPPPPMVLRKLSSCVPPMLLTNTIFFTPTRRVSRARREKRQKYKYKYKTKTNKREPFHPYCFARACVNSHCSAARFASAHLTCTPAVHVWLVISREVPLTRRLHSLD